MITNFSHYNICQIFISTLLHQCSLLIVPIIFQVPYYTETYGVSVVENISLPIQIRLAAPCSDPGPMLKAVFSQLTGKSTGLSTSLAYSHSLVNNGTPINMADICTAEIYRKQHRYHDTLLIYNTILTNY